MIELQYITEIMKLHHTIWIYEYIHVFLLSRMFGTMDCIIQTHTYHVVNINIFNNLKYFCLVIYTYFESTANNSFKTEMNFENLQQKEVLGSLLIFITSLMVNSVLITHTE